MSDPRATAAPPARATAIDGACGTDIDQACGAAAGPGIRAAGVIGGFAGACGIALTATAGWLIVAASHRPVILTLLAVIVAVRTFGIARPVLRYVERVRSHDAALQDLARRRVAAYRALVPLTPVRLGRRARADVLTAAVADLEDLVYAQVRVVVPVLGAAVAGALAVLVLAVLVPLGGLVVAAVVAAHAVVADLGRRWEIAAQSDWLAARERVARATTMVTGYAAELAGIGAADDAVGWVSQAQDALGAAARRLGVARAATVALSHLVTGVGTVGAALAGSAARAWGLSDTLAAVLVLSPLAVGDAFVGLPDAMGAWARARGSRLRLGRLLRQPPAVRPGASAGSTLLGRGGIPRIDLQGVSARWQPLDEGGPVAPDLPPTTLSIEPGEHVVLVGPNGSGKSTLLAVLARALDPEGGRYLIDGVDVRTLGVDQVRALVAVVDDEPHVFATTLRENVRLASPGCDDDAVVEALEAAGLRAWSEQLPDGLDTMLGTGGRGVSGGERARLALARAHVSGRPLILLDEPVAHLDHATAIRVLRDIRDGLAGRTVVLVSHRGDTMDDGARVLDLASLTG